MSEREWDAARMRWQHLLASAEAERDAAMTRWAELSATVAELQRELAATRAETERREKAAQARAAALGAALAIAANRATQVERRLAAEHDGKSPLCEVLGRQCEVRQQLSSLSTALEDTSTQAAEQRESVRRTHGESDGWERVFTEERSHWEALETEHRQREAALGHQVSGLHTSLARLQAEADQLRQQLGERDQRWATTMRRIGTLERAVALELARI